MVKAVQTSVQGTSRSTTDMTLQCADHGMRSEYVAQIPTMARVCLSLCLSQVTLVGFFFNLEDSGLADLRILFQRENLRQLYRCQESGMG